MFRWLVMVHSSWNPSMQKRKKIHIHGFIKGNICLLQNIDGSGVRVSWCPFYAVIKLRLWLLHPGLEFYSEINTCVANTKLLIFSQQITSLVSFCCQTCLVPIGCQLLLFDTPLFSEILAPQFSSSFPISTSLKTLWSFGQINVYSIRSKVQVI